MVVPFDRSGDSPVPLAVRQGGFAYEEHDGRGG
jgi:hypothetical protein